MLPFGLGTVRREVQLLGVVMVAVASTGWPGLVPLALGIVAGVVVWTGAHIWWISTVHAAVSAGDQLSRATPARFGRARNCR